MDDTTLEIVDADTANDQEERYEYIKSLIEEECDAYLQQYLSKENTLIEQHIDFIEEHLRYQFKNYLRSEKLLQKIHRLLKINDPNFASKSLQKIQRDIESLNARFNEFLDRTANPQKTFQQLFFYNSTVHHVLKSQINHLKKQKLASSIFKKELKLLEKNLKRLQHYYFVIYQEIHAQYRYFLIQDFKNIINTYLYYYEALLWFDAEKSQKIGEKFKLLGIKAFSTKAFLEYRIQNAHPYTQEYEELKKMYRTYI